MRTSHVDFLEEKSIDLDKYLGVLESPYLHHLQQVIYCGNLGDPLMHPDAMGFFKSTQEKYPYVKQKIYSNCSLRSVSFWEELATIPGLTIVADIDGLEDTNHIYRDGSKWTHIMRNLNTFIKAGGNAEWVFIVFNHNEHQIEEARKFAKDMGFSDFAIKKTSRAIYGNDADKQVQTKSEQYQPDIIKDGFKEKEIECLSVKNSRYYLSYDFKVYPCCWVAAKEFSETTLYADVDSAKDFYNHITFNNSINEKDFDDIIDDYYEEMDHFEEIWQSKTDCQTCVDKCGSNGRHQWERFKE